MWRERKRKRSKKGESEANEKKRHRGIDTKYRRVRTSRDIVEGMKHTFADMKFVTKSTYMIHTYEQNSSVHYIECSLIASTTWKGSLTTRNVLLCATR